MCPCNQNRTDVGETEIFDAQRMDPIYAEDHSILLSTRFIQFVDRLGHLPGSA